MTVCSDRRRHVTCDVTWCCSSCRPAYYTRTHHNHQVTNRSNKIQILASNIQQEQGKESVKQDREREREIDSEITIAGYSKIKGQRKKKDTEKSKIKSKSMTTGKTILAIFVCQVFVCRPLRGPLGEKER